ncbi:Protoheme IX farnesyltransferase, mitochondrial [Dimargaris cristalligena]|nr:Protoheme IX farnesyltransferase, mitochondrial [Dimargaris cristalligena]
MAALALSGRYESPLRTLASSISVALNSRVSGGLVPRSAFPTSSLFLRNGHCRLLRIIAGPGPAADRPLQTTKALVRSELLSSSLVPSLNRANATLLCRPFHNTFIPSHEGSTPPVDPPTPSTPGPLDTDLRWRIVRPARWSEHIGLYQELSKSKLASLVVLTTMCGYAVAPGAMDLPTLLYTTVGTGLCVASANTFNQWIEVPYDAQMMRTRNRVLVRGALTPLHAFSVGVLSGTAGIVTLATLVNPLTAVLGAANIVLYSFVYTCLKRVSIVNTWVGAVVGALPPMMGWTACLNSLDPGAWLLGIVLYAWQFPHFNSLSWPLRKDYSRAGYRMTVVTNPALNARVSLRYSVLLAPLSLLFPYFDVTTWWFALDSMIVNLYLIYRSYQFWQHSSDRTYRPLFFASLVHLPVYLLLLLFHKKPTVEQADDQSPEPISLPANL